MFNYFDFIYMSVGLMVDWIPKAHSLCLFMSSWQITFVDFIMYELLDQHRMFQPSCLDEFKGLRDLSDRFEVRKVRRDGCTFRMS